MEEDLLNFQEAHTLGVVRPQGKDWDVVLIRPGLSKNGNFYPADVLRKAAPLFENARACAYRFGAPLGDSFDHLPQQAAQMKPEGFVENEVGYFSDIEFKKFTDPDGNNGEGLVARFHIYEGHDWLRKSLKDSWQRGKTDFLGFSIDADGQARDAVIDGNSVRVVERITKVRSTDVVSRPAAGGSVLRLVASEGKTMDELKSIYKMIQEGRPMWLEGFAKPTEDQDMETYLLDVLESCLAQAESVQRDVGLHETTRLAEVARGVNTLATLVGLIRSGKSEEAMKIIRNWISVYPVANKGDEKSRRQGFYSFPYTAPQGGYPGVNNLKAYGEAPPARASASTQESEEDAAMDEETRAKLDRLAELEKAEEERLKEAEVKEAELAQRERVLKIKERVNASDLPELARERVIESLSACADEMTDERIDEALGKERDYIASLTVKESGRVKGLGDAHTSSSDVEVGKEKYDKFVSGFDGLFSGGMDQDGVPAFRSMHEAFGKVTGKYFPREQMADYLMESIAMAFPKRPSPRGMEIHLERLHEGVASKSMSYSLREAVGTSDFSVAFGDALFRRLQKEYKDDPRNDWRRIVSSIENLSDLTNKFNFVRIGGVGVLPDVAEKAPYQEFTDPTEVNEQMTPKKKGALLKLTWEDMLADRIGVIRRIPSVLARAAVRTIHELVWDEIDANPLMADSVALINATHNNLVSGSPALSYTNVTTAIQQLREQTEQDSGKKLGLSPAFLLVGPQKENEAIEITDSTVKVNAAEDATAASFVNRIGVKTFATLGLGRSTSPDTSKRWYISASPQDAETIAVGFLGGRDRPDIFVQSPVDTPTSGGAFDADSLTFKIRLGVGAKVLDHRAFVGSLATT